MQLKAAAMAALLALSLSAAGCGASASDSVQATQNDDCGYVLVDSLNVSGDPIGKRALRSANKGDFKAMSAVEFEEFVAEEVAAAGDSGADYFTVAFEDGTGLTFPSCAGSYFFYGKLDSEGMMAGDCITYVHKKDGWKRS